MLRMLHRNVHWNPLPQFQGLVPWACWWFWVRSWGLALQWCSPGRSQPLPLSMDWASLQHRGGRFLPGLVQISRTGVTGGKGAVWHSPPAPKNSSGPAWDRPDKRHQGFWARWTPWSGFCWSSLSAVLSAAGRAQSCAVHSPSCWGLEVKKWKIPGRSKYVEQINDSFE